MKKLKLLLTLLGVLIALPAFARDFTYTYEGQTLKYTVIDEEAKTCSTKIGSSNASPGNNVSGNLVIPEIAKDGDTEYTVTSIGNCAFSYCTGLISVIIPNSVKTIGKEAFSVCSGLTSVAIPNSVASIGDWAFYGCTGLTEIAIPNSVQTIGTSAFAYCDGLTSVTIPTSVQTIGSYAFANCNGLKSVFIPNSVTSIGSSAFSWCSGLTSVIIPNSVTSIGSYAFANCDGLKSVYYAAKEPIKGNINIFDSWGIKIYDQATLYVPEEAVEKCKLIDPWKNFANIQAYDFSGIEEIEADFNADEPFEVYDMSGALMGNSLEGLRPAIYIVRQGSKATKVAVR